MSKIKIKKRKVLEINAAIEQFGNEKLDVQFSYALAKNKVLLENEVMALQAAIKPSEEYMKYENARLDLCRNHAKKDDNGLPLVRFNQFVIDDQKSFDDGVEALRKKNKKVIEEHEDRVKTIETLLDEEVEVEYCPIQLSSLPKQVPQNIMNILIPLITE